MRFMIKKWHTTLAGYSPQVALNFLKDCMVEKWHHVMDTSKTLAQCLEKFGTYAASEDLLLRKMLEKMKSWPYCRTYTHDMKMIDFCKTSLVRMLKLNAAFHLDHTSAKQIISKLSAITMREKFISVLNDLRYREKDTHGVDNYVRTLQEVLAIARVDV